MAEFDQAEVLKFLLELKKSNGQSMIDINAANEIGETLAYTAAVHNALKVLKLLIEMGADMNKSDINGATPLHGATFNKSNYEAYEFLLKSKKPNGRPAVDPTLADDSGLLAADYLSSGEVEVRCNRQYFPRAASAFLCCKSDSFS